MLRRKSEFWDFLYSICSLVSEKEGLNKEGQLSPYEEYLQLLLQMKMASDVSEWRDTPNPLGFVLFFLFKHTVNNILMTDISMAALL